MEFVDALIRKYFFLMFAVAIIFNACVWMYKSWRRAQQGPRFPSISQVQVRFREQFASGYSHKSWLTRLGGASNCLTVTVTEDELWVTSFFPFNLFLDTYDLEHRIAMDSICHVEQQKRTVRVDFTLPHHETRRITLISRKASELCSVLTKHGSLPNEVIPAD